MKWPHWISKRYARKYWLEKRLHLASKKNLKEVINDLINKGVSVNAVDRYNHSALYHAVVWNCLEAAEVLCANGAEVQHEDNSILFHAIIRNNVPMIVLLLNYGADLSAKDRLGFDCIRYACYNAYRVDSLKYLVKIGVRLDNRTTIQKFDTSLLHLRHQLVCKRCCSNVDDCEMSTLAYCVHRGLSNHALILLRAGASVELARYNGISLLARCTRQTTCIAEFLLRNFGGSISEIEDEALRTFLRRKYLKK